MKRWSVPPETLPSNPKPDPITQGVAIAERDEVLQVRPERIVLEHHPVDPSTFEMLRGSDTRDLEQGARVLYESGGAHQQKHPDEAKRLFEFAAHGTRHNIPLQPEIVARLAELGSSLDPVPPEIRRAGDEAVTAYVDVLTEASYARAIELLESQPEIAIAHFRRIVVLSGPDDPHYQKAVEALSRLGRWP